MTNLVKGEWYLYRRYNSKWRFCGELPEEIEGDSLMFKDPAGLAMFINIDKFNNYFDPIPRTITVELPKPLTEMPESGSVYVLQGGDPYGWDEYSLSTSLGKKVAQVAIENRMAYATQAEAEAAVAALRKAGAE